CIEAICCSFSISGNFASASASCLALERIPLTSACAVASLVSRSSICRAAWRQSAAPFQGSATRISSEAGLARLGIVPGQRLELPSNEAVVHALKRGYGIAAISQYVVAAELRTGSLV